MKELMIEIVNTSETTLCEVQETVIHHGKKFVICT